MRPRSAAIIACRVIAIDPGTQAITFIIGLLVLSQGQAPGEVWALPVISLLVAFLLWVGAESVRMGMARGTDADPGPSTPRPLANLYAVALSIAGVVLIAQAIPSVVGALVRGDSSAVTSGGSSFFVTSSGLGGSGAAIASLVAQIGIGALLAWGSPELGRSMASRAPEPEQEPRAEPPA